MKGFFFSVAELSLKPFVINSGWNCEPLAGFLADAVGFARISCSSWHESVIFPEKTSKVILTDCGSETTRRHHLTLWSAALWRNESEHFPLDLLFLLMCCDEKKDPSIGTIALQHDYGSLIITRWVHRCRDTKISRQREKITIKMPMPLYSSQQQQHPRSVTSVYLINTNAERRKQEPNVEDRWLVEDPAALWHIINVWICPEVRDEGGLPSSSSIIHQCAELQTAHRGGRAALHLTSACFCLHTHTRAARRTHHTLLTPAAQTRPAQRRRQTGAGRHVQSRSCNQREGGRKCFVCGFCAAALNFPEEPAVSSRARKTSWN